MPDQTLHEIQTRVDAWVMHNGGYWHPLAQTARLMEELGETARLVNHLYGDKPKKASEKEQELGEEIADLFFTLVCLANQTGVDLQASFERVIQKIETRDKGRFTAHDPIS
ncbi:MAG: nucleotide pyrophosphohydrolase [Anaerolineae bacterium]|nr:nucleotide pyrophosphohydrolase [Anaerolineae bacterium]